MILWELFSTFFKIGLFTFGGGYAMLPLIQAEVIGHSWMSPEALINFIAISESTPGPFAINTSTFVGTEVAGIPGGFFATLGVVMPSFIIILIVAKCYDKFSNSKLVKGIMTGLKPAVIGLIASAVVSVAKTVFFPEHITVAVFSDPSFYISLVTFAVMTVFSFKKLHPIVIICLSAAIGIAAGYLI